MVIAIPLVNWFGARYGGRNCKDVVSFERLFAVDTAGPDP
jgi:hypothetical protein